MISRSTVVGGLIVVELAIVGAAASALTGGGHAPHFGQAAFTRGHLGARDIGGFSAGVSTTPLDTSFPTGPVPHVAVDVPDVRVVVEASASSSTVRVIETMTVGGFASGSVAPIVAERTEDGIRVHAPGEARVHFMIGDLARTVRVIVPATALVEISNNDRIDASGLRTKLVAHTTDGSVHVRNHRGELDVSSDDGRIYLDDVDGRAISAHTHSGRLYFNRVGGDRLDAHTDFGRIFATDVRAVDGSLTTRDGAVEVGFTRNSDATAMARATERIQIRDFTSTDSGTDQRTLRLGSGRGHFEVSTGDGSITITQGANV